MSRNYGLPPRPVVPRKLFKGAAVALVLGAMLAFAVFTALDLFK